MRSENRTDQLNRKAWRTAISFLERRISIEELNRVVSKLSAQVTAFEPMPPTLGDLELAMAEFTSKHRTPEELRESIIHAAVTFVHGTPTNVVTNSSAVTLQSLSFNGFQTAGRQI